MTNLTLLEGDYREVLGDLQVDAIICDPPYQISNSGGGMLGKNGRKFIEQIDAMGMCDSGFDVKQFLGYCATLFESKEKFNGVFFCSRLQLIDYLSYAEDNGLQYGVGVWHKTNPPPFCNNKYLNDVEFWLYIKGKGAPIYGDYHSKSLVYTSTVNIKDKKEFGHPTIKPLDLVEKFVSNHTKQGDVVLDPFMGSGTTGLACKNLNRKFIGVEVDSKYFEIAKGRINSG